MGPNFVGLPYGILVAYGHLAIPHRLRRIYYVTVDSADLYDTPNFQNKFKSAVGETIRTGPGGYITSIITRLVLN